jgi:hypothetical protein
LLLKMYGLCCDVALPTLVRIVASWKSWELWSCVCLCRMSTDSSNERENEDGARSKREGRGKAGLFGDVSDDELIKHPQLSCRTMYE